MKLDHEDSQGHPDHRVHLVVREFPERPETRDQWGSRVIEDQTDLQENQDLMENPDLQVQQENQDSQDQRGPEDSQDSQDFQE